MRATDDRTRGEATSGNRSQLTTRRDFFLSLPAAVGAVASLKLLPGPTDRSQGRRCASAWRRDGAPVWIVDDDPALGEVYELVLQSAGYATRIFQDRLKALQLLRQTDDPPSLLITDFINGPIGPDAFLQRFRKEHPRVKVLMVTGCDQCCLQRCVAKPDGFLCKPFDLRHLLDAVQRLTGAATI